MVEYDRFILGEVLLSACSADTFRKFVSIGAANCDGYLNVLWGGFSPFLKIALEQADIKNVSNQTGHDNIRKAQLFSFGCILEE